ncbi:MAG: 4-hydroxythreonine-4-phosphate dehydrogenase PdxA [Candidatus Bathyarchaeota archaeon]|nr:MAG: 4-hydroxythreonine-4-phosphate dehydrogenase PdxA [Candidatus Bathyarchaeota archaeon]
MGDPAGIGPEITIRALSLKNLYDQCQPIVIGDRRVLIQEKRAYDLEPEIRSVDTISDARFEYGTIDLLDLNNVKIEELRVGETQPMAGKASYEYIKKGVELAIDDEIQGIVTCPINKEALNKAGYPYPGHTEILAELTGSREFAMMFLTPYLRVILVTIHQPLRKACDLIKKDRVLKTIELAYEALKGMDITSPRIAVAGLNPHASESGMFGREETEEIEPAVELAKKAGLKVVGPISPDTAFWRAKKGDFDIVVAMYHDQGCIPIKLLGFEVGVNMTVGLPIIRTSVDHGTAFRHALERVGANPNSLVEAIKVAAKLAQDKYGNKIDTIKEVDQ